jgi:hypothetical protein
MRNVSGKRCGEKTHFFQFFFFENHTVYEIMWENIVELGRPQVTTLSMRIACWIPKTTNTHSEYVILPTFTRQQWLKERVLMLRCTYSTLPVLCFISACEQKVL